MAISLSVLIPYYNERELLTETLKSLLSQAETPDEVLVYDDGSREPPDAWIPPEFDVRVIRGGVNRGPGFARNRLLDASRCDYVHFPGRRRLVRPVLVQREFGQRSAHGRRTWFSPKCARSTKAASSAFSGRETE